MPSDTDPSTLVAEVLTGADVDRRHVPRLLGLPDAGDRQEDVWTVTGTERIESRVRGLGADAQRHLLYACAADELATGRRDVERYRERGRRGDPGSPPGLARLSRAAIRHLPVPGVPLRDTEEGRSKGQCRFYTWSPFDE